MDDFLLYSTIPQKARRNIGERILLVFTWKKKIGEEAQVSQAIIEDMGNFFPELIGKTLPIN